MQSRRQREGRYAGRNTGLPGWAEPKNTIKLRRTKSAVHKRTRTEGKNPDSFLAWDEYLGKRERPKRK